MDDVQTLARVTWLIGVLMILIGLFIAKDALLIAGGLAVNGGIISLTLVRRS